MTGRNRDNEAIEDILDAIERIERYTASGREAFGQDEIAQDAVLHRLQIIGEAAGRLSTEFRSEQTQTPWQQIINLRHVLVHHYENVDLDIIWSIIEKRLPQLQEDLDALSGR